MLGANPQQISLASPGLNGVNLAAGEATLYSELLGQQLGSFGLKVTSARDIGAALGFERQKQLLGCQESGCLSELAGALGTDGLLLGDIGKLGEAYQINLKILSNQGQPLAVFNAVAQSAGGVREVVIAGARSLAHQLAVALNRPELEPPAIVADSSMTPLRMASFVPIALGAIALGVGAGCEVAADGELAALRRAPTLGEAARHRDAGNQWETMGGALLGVGAAAAAAGVVMFFAGARTTPIVSLAPGGAFIGIAGELP